MNWITNGVNKILLNDEQDYIDLVMSIQNKFPSVEHFEDHFQMEPPDEDLNPNEYFEGIVRPETIKYKPESYPCLYIAIPIKTDDCRGFGGVDGWWDDFVYSKDFVV